MNSQSLLKTQKIGAVALFLIHVGLDLAKDSTFATKHFSQAGYFFTSKGMFVLLLIIFNLSFHLLHKTKTIEESDPVSKFMRVSFVVLFLLYWIIGTYLRLNR